MKYFSILGERCSGTTFVEYAILRNFKLECKKICGKHFFGHNMDLIFNEQDSNETLYIYVVRNPIDWIDSFFKRLHHVPRENKKNIFSFMNNEFYSIYEQGPEIQKEIMTDRNINTKERYKDIFELRKVKNDYMLNTFSKKVQHFLILKYEDLRDNYEETLDSVKCLFELEKWKNEYEKIANYKGTYTALYEKKPILLSNEIIQQIKERVDTDQEKRIGYTFV